MNTLNKFLSLLLLSILLLCHPIWAQRSPPGPGLGNSATFSPPMGVIIIVLIAALFFMGFFSIYIRHCTETTTTTDGRTRRILTGSVARSRRAPRGLDPTVIESFPTFDYAAVREAKIGKGALECAVCLTEFEDEDTLRLIPHCDHVFHPECIDEWLVGHTTCPVCRANLTEPSQVVPAEVNLQNNLNDTVLEVDENVYENNSSREHNDNNICNNVIDEDESMEVPLHGRIKRNRSMMRNISFGRPRWMGKFSRSFSTGHVAVKQWENMDRFTLRLPNEVRRQIMSGKLERSTSLVVLPRESSTRIGYRTGFGEGTSRVRSGSVRSDNVIGRSDRWVFSLAPPFISRAPSVRSPKDVVAGMTVNRDGSVRGSIREGNLRGSVRGDFNRDGSVRGDFNRDGSVRGSVKEGSLRGSVRGDVTRLPV